MDLALCECVITKRLFTRFIDWDTCVTLVEHDLHIPVTFNGVPFHRDRPLVPEI